MCFMYVFLFNATATTEIYTYGHTLSLHDALPILRSQLRVPARPRSAALAGGRGLRHPAGRHDRSPVLGRAYGRGLHRTTNLSRTLRRRMSPRKRHWLMKSEPTDFSIDDLKRVGTEPWKIGRAHVGTPVTNEQLV